MKHRDQWGPADYLAEGILGGAALAVIAFAILMLWAFLYNHGYWPFQS